MSSGAGQGPNQAGLPQPQQNGSTLAQQMHSLAIGGAASGGGLRPLFTVEAEMIRARTYMQDRIFNILLQRQRQQPPLNENERRKFKDIVKRLEEALLRAAHSKEEYMNLETLESRLHNLIRRPQSNSQSQQYPQLVNSSSPIGTMIPTPGMSHSGNSTMIVASSVDTSMISASGPNSIAPSSINTGSLLPSSAGGIHGGSFNRSDGPLSNGYQQSPANFSLSSGGNMSSMGAQTITSQMIPTPGFNSNSSSNSNNNNNQSYMNLESANNGGGFSTVESAVVSQPPQQKQHLGGQNSRILHNLGSHDSRPPGPCPAAIDYSLVPPVVPYACSNGMTNAAPSAALSSSLSLHDDEEMIKSVVSGSTPSYSLEAKLGDCKRAAAIRREALQRSSGRSLEGLPLEGFDYDSILGQCCEMPVGYVQIPVGIAGPLLLDGKEYTVPMATTEGCLVASTNRGCKAIYASGGAATVLLRDGMTRAPVVRFGSASRAAELKFFLEDPLNFESLSLVFNRSSRFGRLQSIKCAIAGKNVYMRFTCSTGDAMGMNMVSKGVQNVLDFLQNDFPDMDVIGISGNFCSDKKPAAVNWIEGRGKSVVCEAVIKEEVVRKVLKSNVAALVELNMLKNLTGSAMAGALGGFNAHASNIVSAIYIATGQDPAQNVESSHCITMMEPVNHGKDLHISVTMPSIEVGTVGGGTQLSSQSACLNLLGVKGANNDSPGSNARLLATIVAGSVLAGELSLMSALAAGQLVKSHLKYNRSSKDMSKISLP